MECCQCRKSIDLTKNEEYEYDYVQDLWCKQCMKREVERESFEQARKDLFETLVKTFKINKTVNWLNAKLKR